jgi:tRNA A-37 threonylcarbamoyl transferase component Bud32
VIWNAKRKARHSYPAGYQFRREGRRELLICKDSELSLHRQGLLNPAGSCEMTSHAGQVMGRGEVLIIQGPPGTVAIRRYRHGGLLRRFTGDRFLSSDRPFQEVAVTAAAKAASVPTLDILAAIKERGWGGWYRGYLITTYLPTTTDLISYLDMKPPDERRRKVIEKAAEAVRKIHQQGIYHADLHLKNFLVEEGKAIKVYLIDFDKSTLSAHLKPARRMKNLKRLDRSAEKLKRQGLSLTSGDKRIFCRAYVAGDRAIQPYLKRFKERYRWYTILYRWGWWIAGIFYPRQSPRRKSII